MPTAPAPLALPDGRPARALWTLDPHVVHLNHGSFGAVPAAAQAHQQALRAEMDANPVAFFGGLAERVGAARADAATFLGAPSGDTALVPNATAGASVLFGSLAADERFRGGDVVVTDHGYGAVVLGAQRLAARWGGALRVARVPLDADDDAAHEAVLAAFTPATRLLVVDHVTSATARLLPVARLCASARERGVLTLVDGAHAAGMLARPLEGLDCDVWTTNLHKWACAPRGTAALVARGGVRDALYPLIDSWGTPLPFPDRFDRQGTLDLTGWLAARTARDAVEEAVGWDAVRAHGAALVEHAAEAVAAALGEVTGEDHRVPMPTPAPTMRLVRLPDGLAATVPEADALRDRVVRECGVAAAFTAFDGVGYWRLSAHAYTTADDVAEAIERVRPLLLGGVSGRA